MMLQDVGKLEEMPLSPRRSEACRIPWRERAGIQPQQNEVIASIIGHPGIREVDASCARSTAIGLPSAPGRDGAEAWHDVSYRGNDAVRTIRARPGYRRYRTAGAGAGLASPPRARRHAMGLKNSVARPG